MVKRPPKLYKIGEVMQYSGLSRQTIHNYTTMGLIQEESRTVPGNHRLYPETVFDDLEKIQELKTLGKPLLEIREIMEEVRRKRAEEQQGESPEEL
jgi:DNA-binding transcriptional MerR regulator